MRKSLLALLLLAAGGLAQAEVQLKAGHPEVVKASITGSIIGVGSVHRFSAVRWGVAGNIILAWILTIPGAAVVSSLIYGLFRLCGAS